MNEEPRSVILQTKNPPVDFKSIATLSFHKMLTWQMMAIISLKMRNPHISLNLFFG